jgi:hypothetical protein
MTPVDDERLQERPRPGRTAQKAMLHATARMTTIDRAKSTKRQIAASPGRRTESQPSPATIEGV